MTEPQNLGDLLKQEAEKYFSRDVVILKAGQNLKLGTIVGKLTAEDKIVALDLTAQQTGAEIAYGVLIQDTDASAGDKETIIVARDATFASNALIWPKTITATEKTAVTNQLKECGILIRKAI